MFGTSLGRCGLAAALLLVGTSMETAAAAIRPDSTLYTTYSVAPDLESASWIVCGSTAETEGCYSSGSLGPFGHIGAMLEGRPTTIGRAVTRKIYVLDVASGSATNGVTLNVYTKTDLVSDTDDKVTVTFDRAISLPLVGGTTVVASMAENDAYLYVGTNRSTQAVSVEKHKWVVTTLGGFSPPIPVAAITANSSGFVTVTFGAPGGEFSGFQVFGPTGAFESDGGGASFVLGDSNAVVPLPLPF